MGMVDYGQDRVPRGRLRTGSGVPLYRVPLRSRDQPRAAAAQRARRGTYDQPVLAAIVGERRSFRTTGDRPRSRPVCRRGNDDKVAAAAGRHSKRNGRFLLCSLLASGGAEQSGGGARYTGGSGGARASLRELQRRNAVLAYLPKADRWRRDSYCGDARVDGGRLLGGRGLVFRKCFPGCPSRPALLGDTAGHCRGGDLRDDGRHHLCHIAQRTRRTTPFYAARPPHSRAGAGRRIIRRPLQPPRTGRCRGRVRPDGRGPVSLSRGHPANGGRQCPRLQNANRCHSPIDRAIASRLAARKSARPAGDRCSRILA